MSTQFDSSAIASASPTSVRATRTSAASAVAAEMTAISAAPAAPTAASRAAPDASPSAASARSIPWVDRLTLGAIAVVVVVVTLPVLRGFGVRENERDALRMLRVLAAEPAAGPAALAALATDGQPTLADLAAADRVLHRRLEDLEMLPDGRLRRHGYLFDVSALGTGEPMLRAWPWEHAQTGRGAFVWTPRRGILGYGNADGRFSGPESPPEADDVVGAGWVAMPRR